MKNRKFIGTLAGIAAAVCCGTNPLGALKLYATGMQTNSVLFYRFGLAWVIIALVMLFRKENFKVTRQEFRVLTGLGLLFIVSSLTLYLSFHYMAAGVASTILFTYPVMTTAILGALEPLTAVLIGLLVFNEPFTAYLAIGIVLILAAVVIIAMAQQKKQADTLT